MIFFLLREFALAKLDADQERGASMVEYAFLVALIATVCIAGVMFIGTELNLKFVEVGDSLS